MSPNDRDSVSADSSELVTVYRLGQDPIDLPRSQIVWLQRTAVVLQQKCPRECYINYHWNGRGIQPALTPDHFELGSAVHDGLERLVGGQPVGSAAPQANAYFASKAGSLLMAGDVWLEQANPEVYAELLQEQAHLAEGLVWTFDRRIWPGVSATYEVVSLEEEINWLVGQAHDGRWLVMMSRIDGLFRGRADEGLYVVSHKTAKQFYGDTLEKLSIDTQQFTEGLAVQAKYGTAPAGTLYFYFLKGKRGKDDAGYPRHESPLVRPFMDLSTSGFTHDPSHFAIYGKWAKTDQRPGGSLGRGWERVNVWEEVEFDQWLEWLDAGYIQPQLERDWLGELVAEPMVEVWDAQRASEILELIAFEQSKWHEDLGQLPDGRSLATVAPKRTHMCHRYNSKCGFYDICHSGASIEAGLMQGRWIPRISNHAIEDGGE